MTRAGLENRQIPIYLVAIVLGVLIGTSRPPGLLESAILPALAVLLYATFLQVPLSGLRRSLADRKFLAALLITNFGAIPLAVWGLGAFLPDNAAIRLGVFLVLLTPCIDYVVVFTRLGGGDAKLMLAATPLLLVAQMVLLPLYLVFLLGNDAFALVKAGPFLQAFGWIILTPLAAAWLTEYWAGRRHAGARFTTAMGWLPVPMLALTLLLVIAGEIGRVEESAKDIVQILPVYAGYLVVAPLIAWLVARLLGLKAAAKRTLVFSAGTRNSLVVLPLALAVPDVGGLVAAVVVTQTLVELLGELVYIRWVRRLVL